MRTALAALVVGSAMLLAGCAATGQPSSRSVPLQEGTSKRGLGELRTNPAALVERFPALAGAESAAWSAGTLGDDPAPDRATTWMDAVVVLPQEGYDALRSAHEFTAAVEPPALVDVVAASVPSGPLLVSDELDAEFTLGEGSSDVYLDDATRSVVLVVVFP
jgi:hypothetical protein